MRPYGRVISSFNPFKVLSGTLDSYLMLMHALVILKQTDMKNTTIIISLISGLLFVASCSKSEDNPAPTNLPTPTPTVASCTLTGSPISVPNSFIFNTWVTDSTYFTYYRPSLNDTIWEGVTWITNPPQYRQDVFTSNGIWEQYIDIAVNFDTCSYYTYIGDTLYTGVGSLYETSYVFSLTSTQMELENDVWDSSFINDTSSSPVKVFTHFFMSTN